MLGKPEDTPLSYNISISPTSVKEGNLAFTFEIDKDEDKTKFIINIHIKKDKERRRRENVIHVFTLLKELDESRALFTRNIETPSSPDNPIAPDGYKIINKPWPTSSESSDKKPSRKSSSDGQPTRGIGENPTSAFAGGVKRDSVSKDKGNTGNKKSSPKSSSGNPFAAGMWGVDNPFSGLASPTSDPDKQDDHDEESPTSGPS